MDLINLADFLISLMVGMLFLTMLLCLVWGFFAFVYNVSRRRVF